MVDNTGDILPYKKERSNGFADSAEREDKIY
jgi:hypothetical protein